MWSRLNAHFRQFPAQERVAQLLVAMGLRVLDGEVCADAIELSDSAIGRAAGVDRRVVRATVRTIEGVAELRDFFSRLMPVCHLGDVAPLMGWGAIEIVPTNASKPGILAGVSSIIAEAGISIRQVVTDDPEIVDDPRGFIITEAPVPERLLPRIMAVAGVKSVVLH